MNVAKFRFSILNIIMVIVIIVLLGISSWLIAAEIIDDRTERVQSQQEDMRYGESAMTRIFDLNGLTFNYPGNWIVSDGLANTDVEKYSLVVSKRVTYAQATASPENKELYKNDLALHLVLLNPDYYNDYAKSNKFNLDNARKSIGDITIDGKDLTLVGNMRGTDVLNVSIADCDTKDRCNIYSDFGEGQYVSMIIGSIVDSPAIPISVDTKSLDYRQLLDVAASVEL